MASTCHDLAPVALFAYKRADHLRATLDALSRNTLAASTHLHVFSDGPRSEADAAGVAAVRELLRDVSGFASVTVTERPQNMGLAPSVIAGVTALLQHHPSVIVLEDDLVTTPHFLSYMNAALQHYAADPAAFSVTGFNYPTRYLPISPDYPYDTYASYRCCSWSWGTWRDRWEKVDWDMAYYNDFCCNPSAQAAFNQGGQDRVRLLQLQHEGKIDSWAIRFCYALFQNHAHCIYPTHSLVRNIGLDHSGTHSQPNPRYTHESLDTNWMPARFSPADQIDPVIAAHFRAIFDKRWKRPSRPKGLQARIARACNKLMATLSGQQSKPADILMVNTHQMSGGAARAAYRTFNAIRTHYPKARYLCLFKENKDPAVTALGKQTFRGVLAQQASKLDQRPLRAYPARPDTLFTPAVHANPFRKRLLRYQPSLVHLHWVGNGMLKPEELGELDCPIVWTLHDTWAFTGGCHYPADCTRYQQQCGACPQLASHDPADLSHQLLARKALAWQQADLTIVTPSRWLANLARQSHLFQHRRIEVIPNGLDLEAFKPIDREAARHYLGITDPHPVILFGAQNISDLRKGGDLLSRALALYDRPCTLLLFGDGHLSINAAPKVTVRRLGNLTDNASLSLAYSAATLFACPSREDNLPNTVAEALACGTPCLAFHTNGLPDMIDHRQTGWLARPFDTADLAAGIAWLAHDADPHGLREAARARAVRDYSLEKMGERYAALYHELLANQAR